MWIWFLTYLNFHFWRIYESFPAIIHVTISPSQLLLFVITGLGLFCIQTHYFQCVCSLLMSYQNSTENTCRHTSTMPEYTNIHHTALWPVIQDWIMNETCKFLTKLLRVEVIDPFGAETVIYQLDFWQHSGLIDRLTPGSKPRDWG